MFSKTHLKHSIVAGAFLALFSVNPVFAQSVSDGDYLSALDSMVVDMDLDGLADQTFETQTVAAPQLATMTAGMASCEELQAQADDANRPIEIFGADTTLSNEELAALSKCRLSETGLVVSYLMPES